MENLEKRLKEELLKEAEEILAEVEADESLQKFSVTPEMDQALMERIRKEEEKRKAYDLLSEEDKEALCLGREAQILKESEAIVIEEEPVTYKRRKKPLKLFALVAIAAVLVLAMGMTCIGGKPFILDFMSDVFGGREITKVDSTQDNETKDSISKEEAFVHEVEETFGCMIVRPMYLPEATQFLVGEIDESLGRVNMIYEYEEKIIQYQISINYRERVHGYDVEDVRVSEKTIEISSVPIDIKTYELPNHEVEYVAQFEYENTFYILNAAVPEEEFEKILENLYFY